MKAPFNWIDMMRVSSDRSSSLHACTHNESLEGCTRQCGLLATVTVATCLFGSSKHLVHEHLGKKLKTHQECVGLYEVAVVIGKRRG